METASLHKCSDDLGAADVLELRFLSDGSLAETAIELTASSRGRIRSFRFSGAQEFTIRPPFPQVGWLQIHDIRARQLDRLGVYVCDGEQSEAIEFYAANVEELRSDVEQIVATDCPKTGDG